MPKVFQRSTPSAVISVTATGLLTCGTLTAPAHATAVRAEVGHWDYRLTGQTVNGNALDFRRDLDVETVDHDYQRLNVHFGPGWLPEIGLGRYVLGVEGDRVVETDLLSFGEITLISGQTQLDAFADLEDLNLTLRYPVTLGDTLRAHLGVTVRRVDGPVVVQDPGPAGESEIDDLQELFPQLHVAFDWQPVSALTLIAEADWVECRDDEAWQWRVAADWRLLGGLGVSLGYHLRHFSVRGSDLALDADFKGAQLGLIYRWATR